MTEKNNWDRFWNNIDVMDDDNVCWEWKAYKGTNKYAETKWNGNTSYKFHMEGRVCSQTNASLCSH